MKKTSISTYDIGDMVRIEARFVGSDLGNVDPSTISVSVETPSGVTTTYTFPTQIQRRSSGVYYIDVEATEHGTWVYRWASTSVKAAEEGRFIIRKRVVV